MQKLTGSGTKTCLSLPSSGWKHLKVEGNIGEAEEKFYTFTDELIEKFVHQSNKGERFETFNLFHDSTIAQRLFKNVKEACEVKPEDLYDFLDFYLDYSKISENDMKKIIVKCLLIAHKSY